MIYRNSIISSSDISGLAAGGVLFGSALGGIAQAPELNVSGSTPFTILNANNIIANVIRGSNRLETDSIRAIGGTFIIENTLSNFSQFKTTAAGGLQSYLANTHVWYDTLSVPLLQLNAGLLQLTTGNILQLDNQELRQKVNGSALATPPAAYMHFGFRIIAGIRTPVFVGQDGIQHTITFV